MATSYLTSAENKEFEIRGIHHLALVCRDMQKTVDFYTNVLGMPLVKTIDLPAGMGQHFFFDCGNGDSLAFFWFPEAHEAVPGIAAPEALVGQGPNHSAHGSMNHVAFNVPAEKFDEYRDRLEAKGVDVTMIFNHDNSPAQISEEITEDVFVRSMYFFDPDGVMLEFATWTADFGPEDARHRPATADDKARYMKMQEEARERLMKMIDEAKAARARKSG